MDRLQEQMKFILEIDKLKRIQRQTYISDGSRQETDAEHSWHLAIMCFLLKEHANEEIDVLKTILMVLIHDIVEIDAGDTFAYDEEGLKTKEARETAAADRIFNLLPFDQAKDCLALWQEFERRDTPESKFANTLDRIQPMMLNDATNGISWRKHSVSGKQVLEKNGYAREGSETIWQYGMALVEENICKGNLKKAASSE